MAMRGPVAGLEVEGQAAVGREEAGLAAAARVGVEKAEVGLEEAGVAAEAVAACPVEASC